MTCFSSASPFRVRRRQDAEFALSGSTVLSLHAEFILRGRRLFLRDLENTNGTCINGAPVRDEKTVNEGDLIQIADIAFRGLCHAIVSISNATRLSAEMCNRAFALVQFNLLMVQQTVVTFFEPIVTLSDQKIVGYTVLGRSKLCRFKSPKDMFLATSQLKP